MSLSSGSRLLNYRSDLPRLDVWTGWKHPYIDNVTKTNRSLFNSWRSGGALSGTSSNNHTNHFSDYSSFHTTTSTQIMATSSGIFRDCTHISFSDTIKSHNNVTFKLVKTGKSSNESIDPLLKLNSLECSNQFPQTNKIMLEKRQKDLKKVSKSIYRTHNWYGYEMNWNSFRN